MQYFLMNFLGFTRCCISRNNFRWKYGKKENWRIQNNSQKTYEHQKTHSNENLSAFCRAEKNFDPKKIGIVAINPTKIDRSKYLFKQVSILAPPCIRRHQPLSVKSIKPQSIEQHQHQQKGANCETNQQKFRIFVMACLFTV